MNLTEEQKQEMKQAAQPLVEFLKKYCNPHFTITVDTGHVELHQGIAVSPVFDK